MKRIFELSAREIMNTNKDKLIAAIRTSEGRTVIAETVIMGPPLISGVSNSELAASFGADMITLNLFDFESPFVWGIDDIEFSGDMSSLYKELAVKSLENLKDINYVHKLKNIIGRFLGVNMEPVPEGSNYAKGRTLTKENLIKAKEYGFDYIVITGNPNTGVTTETVLQGIKLAKEILEDKVMIIAGKMHGAGGENIYDTGVLAEFAKAGADVVLIPAPGTVPGIDTELAKSMIAAIHQAGSLAMTAIGTSQEGAQKSVVENIALMCKMAGADIQHIGDAGLSGVALPENILALSIAIRGVRHTYRRIGCSINK
jgi:hypothetical protein